jgi:hypothetical protein
VLQGSEHPEEAMEFIAYLATEGQRIRFETTGDIPLDAAIAEQVDWAGGVPGRIEGLEVLSHARAGLFIPNAWDTFGPLVDASCQDQPMAQSEPEPPESQLGDAVLDAMRGALRILGGMVQMAAGMTRLLAVAVLKAATAAEKAVEASEERERKPDSEPKPKPRTWRPVERGS